MRFPLQIFHVYTHYYLFKYLTTHASLTKNVMSMFLVSVLSNVLVCVESQPLQYFYTASNVSGEHSLFGGCLLRDQDGVDSEGLSGHP